MRIDGWIAAGLFLVGMAALALAAESRTRDPVKCGRAFIEAAEELARAGGGTVRFPRRHVCPTLKLPTGYSTHQEAGETVILRPDGSRLLIQRQTARPAPVAASAPTARPRSWTAGGAHFQEVR